MYFERWASQEKEFWMVVPPTEAQLIQDTTVQFVVNVVNTLPEIPMPLCGPDEELKLRVVVTGPPSTGCTSLVTRLTRAVFTSTEDLHQQRQQTTRIDIGCQVCVKMKCQCVL